MFVEHYLTPHPTEALPFYIKGTAHFIHKINEAENIGRRDISCHLR